MAQDNTQFQKQLPLTPATTSQPDGGSAARLNIEQMVGQFIKRSIADSRVTRSLPDPQTKTIPVQNATLPPPQSLRPRLKLTPSGNGNVRFIPLPSQQAHVEATRNLHSAAVNTVHVMPMEQASFSILNNAMGSVFGSTNVDFIE